MKSRALGVVARAMRWRILFSRFWVTAVERTDVDGEDQVVRLFVRLEGERVHDRRETRRQTYRHCRRGSEFNAGTATN
jgi:hypothetical protein